MDEKIVTLMALGNCEYEEAANFLVLASENVEVAFQMLEAYQNGSTNAASGTEPTPSVSPLGAPQLSRDGEGVRVARLLEVESEAECPPPARDAHLWESIPSSFGRASLRRLPPWVKQDVDWSSAEKAFEDICENATAENKYVFVSFHHNDAAHAIPSQLFWNHPLVQGDLRQRLVFLDVDITHPSSLELYHSYQMSLMTQGAMVAAVVHPVTQKKLHQFLLLNIAEGSMKGSHASQQKVVYEFIESILFWVSELPGSQNELIPSFADDVVEEEKVEMLPPSSTGTQPSEGSPAEPPLPTVVSLEPYETREANGGEKSIRLRIQFPKSVLDVELKHSTPLPVLLGYTAHRLHLENRDQHPVPPNAPYFLGGFPPRKLEMPVGSRDVTLGEWSSVRNGDKLIAKA